MLLIVATAIAIAIAAAIAIAIAIAIESHGADFEHYRETHCYPFDEKLNYASAQRTAADYPQQTFQMAVYD